MPIKVRCPGCKKLLNAPDKARGKVLKCPKCETRIKVPSGSGEGSSGQSRERSSSQKQRPQKQKRRSSSKSSTKRKRPQSTGNILANLDLSRIEAKGVRICPRCHAEVEDQELFDCEECGADLETGGLGVLERKRKSIKGADPKLYYKGTIKDAWQFYKSNKKLTVITCVSLTLTTTIQCALLYLVLLCVGFPPKLIITITAFVCGMVPYGWIWVLSLQIINNSLSNKKKMHKVNFDFFLSSSMGLKFWLWIIVFPIPFYFISLGLYIWFNYVGYPVIGMSMGFLALAMAFMLAPITGAHLTMPVTFRAWLVNNQLKIFFKKPGPLIYWFAVLLMTTLPALAGFAYVGIVHGKEVEETLYNTYENTLIAAAETYKKPKLGEPDKRMIERIGKEALPLDSSKLIIPAVVSLSSVFWIALVAVFNMRTAGRYVSMFQKELDLITMTKDVVYVRQEVDEFGNKSQVKNVYMLMLVHVLAFSALAILKGPFVVYLLLGLSTSLLWFPVAGLWKVFEKAGLSGQAALFPPLAAIYWARIAEESDAKGLLLLVPVVNIYFGFKMCIAVAERFYKPKGYGVALAILFPIMICVLGSDESARLKKKKE